MDARLSELTPQEQLVYQVLRDHQGRVIGRRELARRAGLSDLGVRRCDAIIVGIRRVVGAERVVTVRRRGWMLTADDAYEKRRRARPGT